MKLDWSAPAKKFSDFLANNGVWIQYLTRVTSGSDAYNTGSTDPSSGSFGYGDQVDFWVTGSLQVVVSHVSAVDIVLPMGYYYEDHEKIWVDPSANIELWDQVVYPSGSGIRYLCLAPHIWRMNDTIIAKYMIIRKLVPKGPGEVY
jgi:hypothetical protein